MPSPGALLLIGTTSAFLGLCLACGLGLLSPKRFAQSVAGAACGVALVFIGVRLMGGGAHG